MKKQIIILALFFVCLKTFGQQQPSIVKDLPNIIPPSPTVAGLMKFEEVPVSNYTGVPSISIPLFSSQTMSKDISIDCSLQYHTGSIAVDEVAGDLGLGWSLTSTGVVSRTVRGLPDEILDKWTKIGIYYDSESNNSNHYYQVEKYINNLIPYGDYYDEFLYDTEKGKYDSEHDLYQFNFLGNSGRFLIKKVSGQNQLEVIRLDQGTAKVVLNYTHNSTSGFSIGGFTIYDDKGYKYVFDEIEYTTQSGLSETIYFDNSTNSTPLPTYNYISSFHLSKIYNQNNILLASFNYEVVNEIVSSKSSTSSEVDLDYMVDSNFTQFNNPDADANFKALGGKFISTNNSRTIASHKISSILVNGISKIYFDYEVGRNDSNIHNESQAKKLKRVFYKDWNSNLVNTFEFIYEYRVHGFASGTNIRMFLTEVKRISPQNQVEKHRLFYRDNPTNGMYVSKDYWGYMNLKPSYLPFLKDTDPSFCTTDVLEKIVYPTGGVRVFDFESNTYSFVGDEPLTNYDENPNNWIETSTNFSITSNGSVECLGISPSLSTIPAGEEYEMTIEVNFNNYDQNLIILKKAGQAIGGIGCSSTNDACRATLSVTGGEILELCYNFLNTNETHQITGIIKYKRRKQNPDQYLFGGGVRIKRIINFENEQESITQSNPVTKIIYDYSYDENLSKSSGALVFPKPLFEYSQSKKHLVKIGPIIKVYESFYTFNTVTNNLSAVKTSGSDVGYKNVKVFQGDNVGYKAYTYTSPLDYPEVVDVLNTNYPFLPVKNFDYKRGLLIEEKIFDNEKILKKTVNEYAFENEDVITSGIRLFSNSTCPFSSSYENYNSYKAIFDYCLGVNQCVYPITDSTYSTSQVYLVCGDVTSFIQSSLVAEALGWAKLIKTNSFDYFYENNNERVVETVQNFIYNPINKKISEHTISNSAGGFNETKYYYHNGNSTHSQNRIAEIQKIEKFKDNQLIETANINYSNTFLGNVSYLPMNITVSKGQLTLEPEIEYISYDENSNPLCLTKVDGTVISYIWGYNKTQPIAKVENYKYSNIDPSLILAVQNASNNSIDGTESSLISALNALRDALPEAMVTTYTYKPLIGVSTITDPKGYTTTYEYDDFGRLRVVIDHQGNVLTENQYHYRTQN